MLPAHQTRIKHIARVTSRGIVLLFFLAMGAGNITNALLLDHGFNDQPVHARIHASLSVMANGNAYRPYAYRSLTAEADRWVSKRLLQIDPGFPKRIRASHLRQHFFPDVSQTAWTPLLATEYALMYLGCVLMTMIGLFFVYRIGRFRSLSWAGAITLMMAFSFVYPLCFARSLLFYDFFEFAGVFAAVSLFLEERLVATTLVIVAFSFVKETFFLVPFGLFFLHTPETTKKKRWLWLAAQAIPSLAIHGFLIHTFRHNPGVVVQFHLFGSAAFWLTPHLWLSFTPLAGPGIFVPRLENPILLLPLALFFGFAWRQSEARWRGYFWAAFLPLLALYIPFCLGDTWRDFQLAFPAVILISLSARGRVNALFSAPDRRQRAGPCGSAPNLDGRNGLCRCGSVSRRESRHRPSTSPDVEAHVS